MFYHVRSCNVPTSYDGIPRYEGVVTVAVPSRKADIDILSKKTVSVISCIESRWTYVTVWKTMFYIHFFFRVW